MTDTWNVFTSADLFLGLLGAVGFMSVVAVIATASGCVDKRENILLIARSLQKSEDQDKAL